MAGISLFFVVFLLTASSYAGPYTAIIEKNALYYPAEGKNAMVVTGQELATQAGLEVLKNGGNAVDAAVTIGFVMAVTLPRAGNIGGGFMLVKPSDSGDVVAIDYMGLQHIFRIN